MKRLILSISITIGLLSCQSDISPKKLIGVWAPTYQIQNKEANGKWGRWITINTLMAIPDMEFTASGDFLRDGKPGAACCSAGNKYTLSGNTITFSEIKDCPNVDCSLSYQWKIHELTSKFLILEFGESRSKYARVK